MTEHRHVGTLTLPPLLLECYASSQLASEPAPSGRLLLLPSSPEGRDGELNQESLADRLLQDIETLWPIFLKRVQAECIPQALDLSVDQTWEVDLTLVDNPGIQSLNAQYRGKDQATDVLSFCLFAEQPEESRSQWASLPAVQLGSIFISLPWAQEATGFREGSELRAYLLERFFHGCLHLLGAHHDTMADYEQVKDIQDAVLSRFETGRAR